MSNFTLSIELGNVAMASAEMVADALRAVADRVTEQDFGNIRDANGNTVGEWSFEEDDDDEDSERDDEGADAEWLASAGHGTDEDYGYYGDSE